MRIDTHAHVHTHIRTHAITHAQSHTPLPRCSDTPFNCDDKTSEDISLADVLLHFQKMPDLEKFGMLGFYRLNGWNQSNRAYKRSHVTSTVILNLNKLKNIEYLKKAFIWEDLHFNRDAENVASGRGEGAGGGGGEAAVICKCYRSAFSTPQLRAGGCHDMVAKKAGSFC